MYTMSTDSIQTRDTSLLVAVVSITDFKKLLCVLQILFLGTFDKHAAYMGECLAESENDCFSINIMLFIFHSKENITVYGVFIVLFGYLNIFRSAIK